MTAGFKLFLINFSPTRNIKKELELYDMQTSKIKQELLHNKKLSETFEFVYGNQDSVSFQTARYTKAITEFETLFGEDRQANLYSAPGRTEIGGNHTDHQCGRVLAAAVNLDCIAVASKSDSSIICIKSEGHEMSSIDLSILEAVPSETNSSADLIRGVAARFKMLGFDIGGFDAYTTSSVLKGSGLSSSAAFEVLIGTIMNDMFNNNSVDAVKIAQIGQYAENVFFGKPCGLMDQTSSSVGGFVAIDFKDKENPIVEKIDFDFASLGYVLCIVNTGGSHSDLTSDYASIPVEMHEAASFFGKECLREVDKSDFFAQLCSLHGKVSDRSILRAIHFFEDNDRVPKQVDALKSNNFEKFKQLIIESGRSSFMYLQNVFACKNPSEQGLSLALAISEANLSGCGAWRVHGGGFAGTIQAFVPKNKLEEYKKVMEAVFGIGSCYVLSIRPVGGIKVL
jgi:galactokinase